MEDEERKALNDAGTMYIDTKDHRMGRTVINGMRWV
jgi:hypothetical protein